MVAEIVGGMGKWAQTYFKGGGLSGQRKKKRSHKVRTGSKTKNGGMKIRNRGMAGDPEEEEGNQCPPVPNHLSTMGIHDNLQ